MPVSYGSLCDDFYVDMYINTKFDLPSARDTLLAFFDRVRKQYPSMATLNRDNAVEFCLEEDSNAGTNRWLSVDVERIGVGFLNPPSLEDAFEFDRFIIDLVPYMLGVTGLDVDSLDVTFGMDFDCSGNHNEVIAEALFAGSAFAEFFDISNAGPLNLSPTVVTALDDECSSKLRLTVDSKTEENEVRTKKYDRDKPISLYLTSRQNPVAGINFDMAESFARQCGTVMEAMDDKIVSNFVMPLTSAIAHRR